MISSIYTSHSETKQCSSWTKVQHKNRNKNITKIQIQTGQNTNKESKQEYRSSEELHMQKSRREADSNKHNCANLPATGQRMCSIKIIEGYLEGQLEVVGV